MKASNLSKGIFLAVLGAALFGLKSIFIKLAFAQGVDPATLLSLRMLISFPLYVIVLLWVLKESPIAIRQISKRDISAVIILGFMGYFLASILDFHGLTYISAQLERLTLFTYPIMVALLNLILFSEKITVRLGFALLLTYVGVAFLFMYESDMGNTEVTKGVILVALAAFSFSIFIVYSKQYINRFGSLIFTSIAMLVSTVFVLSYFFMDHTIADLDVNLATWGFAILLGVVSTLIPSFMVSKAIFLIGSTKASIAGSIGPVFTVLLAVVILGEDFGWQHLLGMLMVVSGIYILGVKRKRTVSK